MFNVMMVAYELGKSLEEVSNFSYDEVTYWLAFFKVRNEHLENARKK